MAAATVPCVLALLVAMGRACAGTQTPDAPLHAALDEGAAVTGLAGLSKPEQDLLRGIYGRHNFTLLWSSDGHPTPQAVAVAKVLASAANYGLNPGEYRARPGDDAPAPSADDVLNATEAAQFDVALSAAALRFVEHVHAGRVDPRAAGFNIGATRPALDAAAILERLARERDPVLVIASVEPPFVHYRLLKDALARYRKIAAAPPLPALAPLRGRPVKPGEAYDGAAALRVRLVASGDLPADAAAGNAAPILDAGLVAALKRYQGRHQLDADGVLGAAVVRELSIPMLQRVRQIELALERFRWLPALESPSIIVNIPQFRLFAFKAADDRAADVLQMDVIVGRSYPQARTPVFAEQMRYVIFRPYWDVPYSITRREMLPKIAGDPSYLARERLEIVAGPDDTARPLPASAENIRRLESGALRLRQQPGPDNSLGLVKFMLPNAYNVYLHSTPARQLFSRSVRAFSHGCIRVRDPVTLAAFVLQGTPGDWTPERITAAMDGPDSLRVGLARPIPVMIVYTTALATEAGPVLFFHDIYGHDRELERLLGLAPVAGS
jgi:murein L,D-transpeptidase YcbB/YkuD